MKIYTKTGDAGQSSLYSGERVAKSDARFDVIGTLDELNAGLGLAVALGAGQEVKTLLESLQNLLFRIAADVATLGDNRPVRRMTDADVAELEAQIDRIGAEIPELHVFVLPGGNPAAAQIHVCRTVCRRAERDAIRLDRQQPLNRPALVVLNRLSDLLFVLARLQNHLEGTPEPTWRPE